MVGWYSNGHAPLPDDYNQLNTFFQKHEGVLLFLLFDNIPRQGEQSLPFKLFERKTDTTCAGVHTPILAPLEFNVDTNEAERISLNHVTRTGGAAVTKTYVSDYITNLQQTASAVKMLLERISTLRRFIRCVSEGQKEFPHALLRDVKALCQALQAAPSSEFLTKYEMEQHDALNVASLAVITKAASQVADLMDSFTSAQDRKQFSKRYHCDGR
eukprot:GHVR01006499.1.p1 GENE.GHVR01006499.1~~GHVR01006499.1.p1  ORF type:complete len:214 (+),score=41.82 GHVR01006499.1:462-1103(+)